MLSYTPLFFSPCSSLCRYSTMSRRVAKNIFQPRRPMGAKQIQGNQTCTVKQRNGKILASGYATFNVLVNTSLASLHSWQCLLLKHYFMIISTVSTTITSSLHYKTMACCQHQVKSWYIAKCVYFYPPLSCPSCCFRRTLPQQLGRHILKHLLRLPSGSTQHFLITKPFLNSAVLLGSGI